MSSQETTSSQRKEEVSAAAVAPQGLAAHPLAASGGQFPLSAAGAVADVAPAPASSARATTAEVWNITANGYTGQLIFSAVGSYTHPNVLRGTTYFGTVYDDPMLSYFVAAGNDVHDLGFLRADDPTFRYFQLYFGQWFPSQGLMSGEFFGFQRTFLGLGYSTDGPFPWQATLAQYGTYGLFTDAHPTWRLRDWVVNGPNYGYKDLSLAPYKHLSASHAFMQGHVKQGPVLGHWRSPYAGANIAFMNPVVADFRQTRFYYGTETGQGMQGTSMLLTFDRQQRKMTTDAFRQWEAIPQAEIPDAPLPLLGERQRFRHETEEP
jgi:hypothetical protein